jgi:predicted ferric reductase
MPALLNPPRPLEGGGTADSGVRARGPGPAAGHWAVRAVLVAGGLAVAALWWGNTIAGSLSGPGAAVTAVGRVTGLFAGYLVLVQLLLLARLPWFERAVGLDRLSGWHRGLGTNTVVLICAHVLLTVEGYSLTASRGTASEAWAIVRTYPDMLKATVGLGLFLLVGVTSGARLRRRLSYEAWYWLHVSAYLAVALAFFHQISTGADFHGADPRHVAARWLWTAMYAAVALAVTWWRIALPVRGWFRHQLRVERVVREADGVVSVWVRGRHLQELGGRSGQFLLWRFVTPGHLWTAHPYSLSAPPTAHRLRLTVKDAGDHSGALARLHPGAPVLAEGPFGHFTAERATRRAVLLIAGGSGIGPVRALAEDLANQPTAAGGPRRGDEVTVLYRASTAADLALADELDDLTDAGQLTVRYLVGRRAELGADPLAPAALAALVPDVADRDVYVCGPVGMTDTVRRSLRRLRVPRRQVHIEEFSLR